MISAQAGQVLRDPGVVVRGERLRVCSRNSFAYEYVSLGKAPINTTRGPLAGPLQGDYESNSLNVIGFTVSHRF